MDYWHITARFTFDTAVPEELTHVAETLLADHVGHLTFGSDGRRCTVRLYVLADTVAAATGKSLHVLHHVARDAKWPAWTITEAHARLNLQSGPRLVTTTPGQDVAAT